MTVVYWIGTENLGWFCSDMSMASQKCYFVCFAVNLVRVRKYKPNRDNPMILYFFLEIIDSSLLSVLFILLLQLFCSFLKLSVVYV